MYNVVNFGIVLNTLYNTIVKTALETTNSREDLLGLRCNI